MVFRGGGMVLRGWGWSFVVGNGRSWWEMVVHGEGWLLLVGGWSFIGGRRCNGVVVRGHLGVWGHRLWGVVVRRGSLSSVGGCCRPCVGCGRPWGVHCRPWVGHGRLLMGSRRP